MQKRSEVLKYMEDYLDPFFLNIIATGVSISTTLTLAGSSSSVWIFQISGGMPETPGIKTAKKRKP